MVEIDDGGNVVRVVCGRAKVEHVHDLAEEGKAPTCPTCRKAWEKRAA